MAVKASHHPVLILLIAAAVIISSDVKVRVKADACYGMVTYRSEKECRRKCPSYCRSMYPFAPAQCFASRCTCCVPPAPPAPPPPA